MSSYKKEHAELQFMSSFRTWLIQACMSMSLKNHWTYAFWLNDTI